MKDIDSIPKTKVNLLEKIIKKEMEKLLFEQKKITFITSIIIPDEIKNDLVKNQVKIDFQNCSNELWHELYDYFKTNDFFLFLNFYDGPHDALNEFKYLDSENNILLNYLNSKENFNKMINDLIITIGEGNPLIDIIELLIQNEQHSKLSEIITSPKKCPNRIIYRLIKNIRDICPNKINEIFATIPSSNYCENISAKDYHTLVSDCLKESVSSNYLKALMYDFIDYTYPAYGGFYNWQDFHNQVTLVKTFLEYNLVNYKDIIFLDHLNNQQLCISAAAKSFAGPNYILSNFLYKLEDNLELNEEIRNDSDKYIINTFFNNVGSFDYHIYDFIWEQNFIGNVDKFEFLFDLIKNKKEDYPDLIPNNKINDIVKLFLARTNKEDHKKIIDAFNKYKRKNKVLTIFGKK